MTTRTTRTAVTFRAPWQVPGTDLLPAGTYDVDTDEAAFEGNVRTVYQRIATTLRLPTDTGFESHSIDPKDLEQALMQDALVAVAAADALAAPDSDEPEPAASIKTPWRWVPLWMRTPPSDTRP